MAVIPENPEQKWCLSLAVKSPVKFDRSRPSGVKDAAGARLFTDCQKIVCDFDALSQVVNDKIWYQIVPFILKYNIQGK